MVNKINILYRNVFRDIDSDRSKIDNTLNARFNKIIGGTLGALGRSRNNPNFDVQFHGQFLQPLGTVHFKPCNFFTDLERITVKRTYQHKTALSENLMPQKGPAEVTDTYHGNIPNPINTQGLLDGRQKILHIVADPTNAKFAEISKILTYLGRINSTRAGQPFRGDNFFSVLTKGFQYLDIRGKTLDRGPWYS